jgi:hypothetical protein
MSCVAPANSTDGECRTVTEAPTPAPTAAPTNSKFDWHFSLLQKQSAALYVLYAFTDLNLEYGHKMACELCTTHAHLLEIMTAFSENLHCSAAF